MIFLKKLLSRFLKNQRDEESNSPKKITKEEECIFDGKYWDEETRKEIKKKLKGIVLITTVLKESRSILIFNFPGNKEKTHRYIKDFLYNFDFTSLELHGIRCEENSSHFCITSGKSSEEIFKLLSPHIKIQEKGSTHLHLVKS